MAALLAMPRLTIFVVFVVSARGGEQLSIQTSQRLRQRRLARKLVRRPHEAGEFVSKIRDPACVHRRPSGIERPVIPIVGVREPSTSETPTSTSDVKINRRAPNISQCDYQHGVGGDMAFILCRTSIKCARVCYRVLFKELWGSAAH